MQASPISPSPVFRGNAVVRAAFVLAVFGWGVGFYGPPIFLHAVVARTGWSLSLVSAAVTLHFLFGAGVVACLPWLHRRLGVPTTTAAGAIALTLGTIGWAAAAEPWHLCVSAMLTGDGWVPLGAAGINAIISPWFVHKRPMALAKAYNGASVGGMIFSPLWVTLIDRYGFLVASIAVGTAMVTVVLPLARGVLSRTPADEGQRPDGATSSGDDAPGIATRAPAVPDSSLWRERAFLTLAAAMALGLFAQIGLLTQLFSLMVPITGTQAAAWMMAVATGCGMGGRLLVARILGPRADRRRAASASYAIQAVGTMLLLMAAPGQWPLIVLAVVLFGLGIGNATSLPPLIAQVEFSREDVPRVVARCVACAQALYAFAPAALAPCLSTTGR